MGTDPDPPVDRVFRGGIVRGQFDIQQPSMVLEMTDLEPVVVTFISNPHQWLIGIVVVAREIVALVSPDHTIPHGSECPVVVDGCLFGVMPSG